MIPPRILLRTARGIHGLHVAWLGAILTLMKVVDYPQVQAGLTVGGWSIMLAMGLPPERPSWTVNDGMTRMAGGLWALSWWRQP